MTRRAEGQRAREALARDLSCQLAACGTHAQECSLLLFRLIERAGQSAEHARMHTPWLHAQLAGRLRGLVRATDGIEVAGTAGVAVLLHEAGYAGAHAARERICAALNLAAPADAANYPLALGMTTLTGAWRHADATVADVVRRAWQAQTVVPVALSLPAADDSNSETALDAPDIEVNPGVLPVSPPRPQPRRGERVKSGTRGSASRRQPRRSVAMPGPVESAIMREHALALGVPYVELPSRVPPGCRRAVAPELARELRVVPIGRTRGTLTVAMHDPADHAAVQRLGVETGLSIFPVLAAPDALDRALSRLAAHSDR